MKKVLLATAMTAALISSAQAEVRINGFANVVVGSTGSDESLYGYDDNFSFSEESLFALQASSDINERMTATVQILARGVNDYDVDFEWAYVTYQATNTTSISAGRFRVPLFRFSDSLDVGYSHHWVAAPRNVYDVPFNDLDGFRFDYSDFVGDWQVSVGAAVGTFDNEVSGGDIEGDNTYMVSAEVANDWLSLRTVYGRSKVTFSQPQLDPVVDQIAQAAPELGEFLRMNDDTAEFYGVGLEADLSSFFFGAEYTEIEIADSYTPTDTAWYVTAGFRAGNWTPSITYESFEGDEVKGLDQLNALPPQLAAGLRPAVLGINAQFAESFTVATATLRYEFDANVALKADVSRYTDELRNDEESTLVRFAINYVF
ncbi:porin [Glaciecola siphonariae]|uniref:Porin n=1 Tax=Glaciecola siphonariae TaxID=521012 RepID=A0ABV9LXK5_9ALTE